MTVVLLPDNDHALLMRLYVDLRDMAARAHENCGRLDKALADGGCDPDRQPPLLAARQREREKAFALTATIEHVAESLVEFLSFGGGLAIHYTHQGNSPSNDRHFLFTATGGELNVTRVTAHYNSRD